MQPEEHIKRGQASKEQTSGEGIGPGRKGSSYSSMTCMIDICAGSPYPRACRRSLYFARNST
jgi:hypothetical protein